MTFRRRSILGGFAAFASLPLIPGFARNPQGPRIGVIGGGIIGASVATQLAKAGADVILFEKSRPACSKNPVRLPAPLKSRSLGSIQP